MTARSLFRIAGLGLALLAPFAAEAQQASNVPRVGLLGTGSPADTAPRLDAFREALRELGYVEGRTIEIESRWAEGRLERFPGFAA